MFEICLEETSRVGLYQYEVSNFARPGHECKHNLTYWNYGEYMGLGPGAASRLIRPDGTREAFTRLAVPGKWMQVVEGGGGGGGKKFKERLQITNSEAMMESLMVGLRTSKGINKQRFESMFNVSLNQVRIHLPVHFAFHQ
jgi:oxygen-independent coproporphyrinogen-3 oxidase